MIREATVAAPQERFGLVGTGDVDGRRERPPAKPRAFLRLFEQMSAPVARTTVVRPRAKAQAVAHAVPLGGP
jgi:hypothetical protein